MYFLPLHSEGNMATGQYPCIKQLGLDKPYFHTHISTWLGGEFTFLFHLVFPDVTLSGRKKYQPEGFEVLNISHWGVKATCPGNVDVEAFSQAYSNLGIEKHTTVGGERREGRNKRSGKQAHGSS